MVNLKLKAMIFYRLQRGTLPRDAMDEVQQSTRKEYTRDELRDAADAAIETLRRDGFQAWWMELL